MTEPFKTVSVGHTVTKNIYVAADGKTVVDPTDKRVAALKYGIGSVITEAQKAALIFQSVVVEPIPDAENRAEPPKDSEKRRGGK